MSLVSPDVLDTPEELVDACSPPGPHYLSSRLRRRGSALLNQQCWLWGQDIKRPEGNSLLAYGFDRLRAPEGVAGSSQYTLALEGKKRVTLWGFGLYYGGAHGVFLNRFDFIPRTAHADDLWQTAKQLSGLPRYFDTLLTAEALEWVAGYESWIARTCSAAYRRQALAGWKPRACPAALMSDSWSDLAEKVARSHGMELHRPACGLRPGFAIAH